MRTLIVLCAGGRLLANKPSIIAKHPLDGELIGIKAIEGVHPDSYDRIVYTVLREAENEYGICSELENAFPENRRIEFCVLDEKTSGPAETAYKTIKQMGVVGEVYIRDSHNYIKIEKPVTGNCIVGMDLTKYEETIENLRSKSFLVLNEQRQVLDIIEKSFRSDVISVGLYGFRSASDFVSAFERLNDPHYPIGKLYISHVISYLIGYSNQMFSGVMASSFEDWSCVDSWHNLQKKYATYFIQLENMADSSSPYMKTKIEELNRLQVKGATIIGCVHTKNISNDSVLKRFNEIGINPDGIVTGVSLSRENIYISDLEVL